MSTKIDTGRYGYTFLNISIAFFMQVLVMIAPENTLVNVFYVVLFPISLAVAIRFLLMEVHHDKDPSYFVVQSVVCGLGFLSWVYSQQFLLVENMSTILFALMLVSFSLTYWIAALASRQLLKLLPKKKT